MTPDDFMRYIRARVTNNKDAAELVALLLAELFAQYLTINSTRLELPKELQAIVDYLEAQRTEPDDSEGIPF